MADIDGMRAELRDLDEQKSELETSRNSLQSKGKNDSQAHNDIRGIDAKIDRKIDRLVEQIKDAGG